MRVFFKWRKFVINSRDDTSCWGVSFFAVRLWEKCSFLLCCDFMKQHWSGFPTESAPSHLISFFPTWKRRSSALCTRTRSLATWPIPRTPQVVWPTSSTRTLPRMMTRRSSTIRTTISPTSRKPRTTFLIGDFVPQKAKKVKKSKKSGKPLLDREREEREGFVISAAESMSKKGLRNGFSVSPKSYTKFFSEESQNLFWRMTSPRTSTKSSTG